MMHIANTVLHIFMYVPLDRPAPPRQEWLIHWSSPRPPTSGEGARFVIPHSVMQFRGMLGPVYPAVRDPSFKAEPLAEITRMGYLGHFRHQVSKIRTAETDLSPRPRLIVFKPGPGEAFHSLRGVQVSVALLVGWDDQRGNVSAHRQTHFSRHSFP